jgi:hypothetical protein
MLFIRRMMIVQSGPTNLQPIGSNLHPPLLLRTVGQGGYERNSRYISRYIGTNWQSWERRRWLKKLEARARIELANKGFAERYP